MNGAFKLPGGGWYLAIGIGLNFFSIRVSDSNNLQKAPHFVYTYIQNEKEREREREREREGEKEMEEDLHFIHTE